MKEGESMFKQNVLQKASHLIDMNDIIREGNPTLRAIAEEVTFPLRSRYHSRWENDGNIHETQYGWS